MLTDLRDYREPRDWVRPWRDPPGFFNGNCPCCVTTSNPQMYTMGGLTSGSSPSGVATCDKSDMTAETTAAVSGANLSSVRANIACAGNPGVSGYTTGGRANISTTPDLATADKTITATDTTSAVSSANLSQAREELCGLSERTTKAYFIGGGHDVGGSLTAVVTADVTTFSGDSTSAATSANLGTAVKYPCGTTGDSSKGYVAGGFTAGSSSGITTGNKLTFSGDSMSATASVNLTVARYASCCGSDGSTKAYFAGGTNGAGGISTVDKVTISTDTTSSTGKSMSRFEASAASDGTKLVCLSGSITDAAGQKITFSTDTVAAFGSGTAGNLSSARLTCYGFSTSAL